MGRVSYETPPSIARRLGACSGRLGRASACAATSTTHSASRARKGAVTR
jgi:hypothetical protein